MDWVSLKSKTSPSHEMTELYGSVVLQAYRNCKNEYHHANQLKQTVYMKINIYLYIFNIL